MLQQFRTSSRNARVFEGRRGAGTRFAHLEPNSDWPHHGSLPETVDDDGYTLLASEDAWSSAGSPLGEIRADLEVVNLEEYIRFYVDGLGFRETDRWQTDGQPTRCRLQYNETRLILSVLSQEKRQALQTEDRRGQGVSIYHMCEDALAIYDAINTRGIATAAEPFVGNRLWVVELTDPYGYRVTFESDTDVPEGTRLSQIRERTSQIANK